MRTKPCPKRIMLAAQRREDRMLSLRLREYWATVSLLYWGAEAPEAPQ